MQYITASAFNNAAAEAPQYKIEKCLTDAFLTAVQVFYQLIKCLFCRRNFLIPYCLFFVEAGRSLSVCNDYLSFRVFRYGNLTPFIDQVELQLWDQKTISLSKMPSSPFRGFSSYHSEASELDHRLVYINRLQTARYCTNRIRYGYAILS